MRANTQQIKHLLKKYNFSDIFREELGWSPLKEKPPVGTYKNQEYEFTPLAQKAGFKIYLYTFPTRIPDEQTLKQIDRPLINYAVEHLTIFIDSKQENQAWLWIKRVENQPPVARLNRLNKNQSGELLAQKIARLFVSMGEEESITLTSILDRVNLGFDVEKVTADFYKQFQEKHADFLGRIKNIPDEDDCKWYTSIMLNRLMFVYFLQRKRLLNNTSSIRLEGDMDYLQNRLKAVQNHELGSVNFYEFLRRLFHEGLNLPPNERVPELEQIIGNIPYINGGIFDVHMLEQRYPDIQISDEAFEQLFKFFEGFDWHLDDHPMRNDREINPDVLGYIFEKYINQKQMGAYYTKEDITGYISKNTIIPFIFEKVAQQYLDAFMKDGPIWSLLRANPNDYIYEEMAHGLLEPLPPEIEADIADIAQRTTWNRTADEQWALPTETWREVVERRRRYKEVHARMTRGEISTINDMITYNLNITQFARDVIATCKKPSLLNAFYNAIKQVTVLDPTCGSGAFLFAALNVLKPLYQICIERMDQLVEEQTKLPATQRKDHDYIANFQRMLNRLDDHRNQEYFILKSIIINNLYGVDIMEEAIEICKLRLFLKLVAQVEKPDDLEPLPDIDFNMLAGNTLIGFTSLDEIRQVTAKLFNVDDTEKTLLLIEQEAREIERAEQSFRTMQTQQDVQIDSTTTAEYKQFLRKKLENLRGELNPYLATEYEITREKYQDAYESEYLKWHKSFKPFHWWLEFNKIKRDGGFDVIIGNPPYVEYGEKVKKQYRLLNYTTLSCGNLHAYTTERVLVHLVHKEGFVGLIVPLPSINTSRMEKLQSLIKPSLVREGRSLYVSAFDERPSNLFVGVDQRLVIEIFSAVVDRPKLITTGINRWASAARSTLFATISYAVQFSQAQQLTRTILKIKNSNLETQMLSLFYTNQPIERYRSGTKTSNVFAYRTAGGRYWKVILDHPFDSDSLSNKIAYLRELTGQQAVALLGSSTFWWYYSCHFDMYNLKDYMIFGFRFSNASTETLSQLQSLGIELTASLENNSTIGTIKSKTRGEVTSKHYVANKSKPIIDEIDRVLAQHYGFTPEELDFIINYDIKYRMGRDNGEESEE